MKKFVNILVKINLVFQGIFLFFGTIGGIVIVKYEILDVKHAILYVLRDTILWPVAIYNMLTGKLNGIFKLGREIGEAEAEEIMSKHKRWFKL